MPHQITVDPEVHFGKPCIAGTRIPVLAVLELVEQGIPFARIVSEFYPQLQIEDVRACVRHAVKVLQAEDIEIAAP